MSNSIKKNFPDCNIIMCYFHMKANIRSRKSSIPKSEYLTILSEISKLHFSISQIEYDELLKTTLKRWKSVSSLVDIHNYFTKQWVMSDYNNWQVFKTPPGFSKTNNPLEQYNCRIKVDFTKRGFHQITSKSEF